MDSSTFLPVASQPPPHTPSFPTLPASAASQTHPSSSSSFSVSSSSPSSPPSTSSSFSSPHSSPSSSPSSSSSCAACSSSSAVRSPPSSAYPSSFCSSPSPSPAGSFSSSSSPPPSYGSSAVSPFTVLNHPRRFSRAPLAAYEACNHFLPFAAVSASCAPHQRYEGVCTPGLSAASSLSAAAEAALSAAPCCACPRAVAGDCRRLRSWERIARVDALQLPGLYEKLVSVLEKKVRVPRNFHGTEESANGGGDAENDGRGEERGRQGDTAGRRRSCEEERGDARGEDPSSKRKEKFGETKGIDAFREAGEGDSGDGKSTQVSRENHVSTPDSAKELGGDARSEERQETRDDREATVCELLLGPSVYNAIEMDVHRTFPSLPFFKEEGQTAMRHILQAYAVFDPEVGYVQGMNFVVGTLLHHSNTSIHWKLDEHIRGVMSLLLTSPDEGALSPRSRFLTSSLASPSHPKQSGDSSNPNGDSGGVKGNSVDRKCGEKDEKGGLQFCIRTREGRVFWLLVAMFYLYDMRRMFLPSLPGIFEKCDRIERMMQIVLPDLAEHLKSTGVSLSLLTSDWLLTLFSYSVPLDVCTAVWTKFFEEGWVFIYKLVIARFKKVKRQMCNQTDLVELVKTAKFSAPQNALAAVGESVVSWLLKPRGSKAAASGEAPAVSYLTSLGLLLQQQLQQIPSQDALTSSLSVSNDPNVSGSKEMWRDIIEDASDMDVDRRLFLQVELEMLDREHVQNRAKRAVQTPERVPSEAPNDREKRKEYRGDRGIEREQKEKVENELTGGGETRRSGDSKLANSSANEAGDVCRKKTVGLWRPGVGAEREEDGRESCSQRHAKKTDSGEKMNETEGPRGERRKEEEHRGERRNESCQTYYLQRGACRGEKGDFLKTPDLFTGDERSYENTRTSPTASSTSDPSVGAGSPGERGASRGKSEKEIVPPNVISACTDSSGCADSLECRDSRRLACSPLLHVEKCLALLRRAGDEELRTETEELCAECFAHQRLLFHVAEQRQHLQQLAIEALKKPKQVPETLRHWTARGADIYDE
ncbi:TBC domain-containing protein [Toxoplasma gondii VEG]|uniref:TBC domain-containing protein n=4 Tax=Toxoplasma gondii TaxID=5811 RepID=B9QE40_TOXGV|nr:TBC domain-containing protein [Toxoplasma gondii VEG]CEL75970.1 TPA: TBC domain-containing protein [Toxoplasma gondii VEG]